MACALAAQLSRKAPGSPGYEIGSRGQDIGSNLGTKMKYIGLITNNSQLSCKSCTPTGSKCKISLYGTVDNNGRLPFAPDPSGAIVNSYVFDRDETLDVGLAKGMVEGTAKMISKIGKSDTLNFSEDDICRQYPVGIVRNDNGRPQTGWCTISDNTIKNMDWSDIKAMTFDSQELATRVKNGDFDLEKNYELCANDNDTHWVYNDNKLLPDDNKLYSNMKESNSTCGHIGFQNMKSNKLNPQNLTFDDDIPMKVYYGLLGVGGIYLLYQLSKKYGIKLNLD